MSTLFYGRAPVPADEAHVRSTVTVVQDDAPPAVETRSPGFNDADTDPDTEGGLTTRQLASKVVPSVQYPPAVGNAQDDLFERVNGQVSTSGTAAARERAGQWGHGTFKVVEGIEPTIREGDQLGQEYFTATERPAAGSGDMLSPSRSADADTTAAAAATGAANARAAYGAFLAHATGSGAP